MTIWYSFITTLPEKRLLDNQPSYIRTSPTLFPQSKAEDGWHTLLSTENPGYILFSHTEPLRMKMQVEVKHWPWKTNATRKTFATRKVHRNASTQETAYFPAVVGWLEAGLGRSEFNNAAAHLVWQLRISSPSKPDPEPNRPVPRPDERIRLWGTSVTPKAKGQPSSLWVPRHWEASF